MGKRVATINLRSGCFAWGTSGLYAWTVSVALALPAPVGAATLPEPVVLDSAAACKLAHQGEAAPEGVYSIRGTFKSDISRGPRFTPEGCDFGMFSGLAGEAAFRDQQFQSAAERKCHVRVMRTRISGVFTGTLVKFRTASRAWNGGAFGVATASAFIVTHFESADSDPSAISCRR